MDRMFLVEKGKFVVIRDGLKEISFINFEEFNKYYPSLDLTGKWYIDYEPERSLYLDNILVPTNFIIVPEYEQVINSIDDLLLKRNDIYFNKTLEEVKTIKKQYIKNKYQEKINEGCLTSLGYRFDSDDKDRANLVASVMLLQLSGQTQIDFIDYSNNSVTLTFAQLVQVGFEVATYFQTLLYTKNQYYKEIESKLSIEDIKLVEWI